MENNKFWWKCDKCNARSRHTHKYKSLFLCNHCFRKVTTTIWGEVAKEYGEYLQPLTVFTLVLTDTQNKLMLKRIKSIFGTTKRKKATYLRSLVLRDLEVENEVKSI